MHKSECGDKELVLDRGLCPTGYSATFASKTDEIFQSLEFDITYDTFSRIGIFNSFNIQLKDANEKTVDIRTNLDIANTDTKDIKRITFSDQKATDAENKAGRTPFANKADISLGATITIKAVINTQDASMTLYANDESLGTLELASWGAYKNNTDFVMSDDITIKQFSLNCESGDGNDIRLDNVTYFTK